MSKEYKEEVRLQNLKEFVDEYANEEELTSVDGVRATIDIIEEQLNNYKKLLETLNPYEALETLKDMLIGNGVNDNINDYVDNLILPIKQALLKAQEPKHYLKWEDLEWEELKTITRKDIKVNLNGVEYGLEFALNFGSKEVVIFDEKIYMYLFFNEANKQFFNNLHLERVEE